MNLRDDLDSTWQIKIYVRKHTCPKEIKNRNVTSKWTDSHYLHKLANDQGYSITSLQQDVGRDFNLLVPLSKCYKAKLIALEMVLGNAKEQYPKIYDIWKNLRKPL